MEIMMKARIAYATAIALSTCLAAGNPANAKGCVKGAIVGGAADHVAGHHGLVGAAVGCAIGHHEASKHQNNPENR
jgi:hypothetical protein